MLLKLWYQGVFIGYDFNNNNNNNNTLYGVVRIEDTVVRGDASSSAVARLRNVNNTQYYDYMPRVETAPLTRRPNEHPVLFVLLQGYQGPGVPSITPPGSSRQ